MYSIQNFPKHPPIIPKNWPHYSHKIQESSTIILQHKWGFYVVFKWRFSLRERVLEERKHPFRLTRASHLHQLLSCSSARTRLESLNLYLQPCFFVLSTCTTVLLLKLLTLLTFAKFEVLLCWNNSRILAGTYYSQNYSAIIGTGLVSRVPNTRKNGKGLGTRLRGYQSFRQQTGSQ